MFLVLACWDPATWPHQQSSTQPLVLINGLLIRCRDLGTNQMWNERFSTQLRYGNSETCPRHPVLHPGFAGAAFMSTASSSSLVSKSDRKHSHRTEHECSMEDSVAARSRRAHRFCEDHVYFHLFGVTLSQEKRTLRHLRSN